VIEIAVVDRWSERARLIGMAARKKAKKTGTKKKSAAKRASGSATAEASKPTRKASAGVSSISVNLGHIFALRPRVNTAFPPGDLNTAKHFLQDESYASIEEAARAVAEKALELTHKSPSRKGPRRL
jgi:DNA-binding ferritin-like protein